MTKGIYAGSFDPFTNGHLDIVKRSMNFCKELHIVMGVNNSKKLTFSLNERKEMIHKTIDSEMNFLDTTNIKVEETRSLIINYAKSVDAKFLIRGVRTVADFEFETNLANINRKISGIDTILLPTAPELSIVSSSMVRELMSYKSDYSQFVPKAVYEYIQKLNGGSIL